MIEKFGEKYTAYILAIGTVSDKGCIDEIGRALYRKTNDDKYSIEIYITMIINEKTYKMERIKEEIYENMN